MNQSSLPKKNSPCSFPSTNLGINYLDYTITNANVQKNIFENVNNISVMNPKNIKKGVIKKPPPTPNKPDRIPTAKLKKNINGKFT